jgi:hypothetical protein
MAILVYTKILCILIDEEATNKESELLLLYEQPLM